MDEETTPSPAVPPPQKDPSRALTTHSPQVYEQPVAPKINNEFLRRKREKRVSGECTCVYECGGEGAASAARRALKLN